MASDGYTISQLSRSEPAALALASAEARDLSRALAAQSVAFDPDAVVAEFPRRVEAIFEAVWPAQPLEGYGFHASLGAHALARVAMGWTASGHTGLRLEPLERDLLLNGLVTLGADRDLSLAVLGNWHSVDRQFVPTLIGLDASRLAGLAECTLTAAERASALSQVASSARCMARLASTISALVAVRAVLPVLAPDDLGHDFVTGLAAIALGRPDRALELLGEAPVEMHKQVLREIAECLATLGRGNAVALPAVPGAVEPSPNDEWAKDPSVNDESADDESANLEAPDVTGVGALIERWRAEERTRRPSAARRGTVLGLRLGRPVSTVPPNPIPPDSALLSKGYVGRFDPIFPPVRSMLRAVVAAGEGHPPSLDLVREAGDLEWFVRRARALGCLVQGDLRSAIEAVEPLPLAASREGRWARDRLHRYEGRSVPPLEAEEARPAAGALAADLAIHLGRTIAGSIPVQPLP